MPPKRPRNLRQVNTDAATGWENDEPTENAMALRDVGVSEGENDGQPQGAVGLDDLLEFQRFRRQRQRGLDTGALAKGERKKTQVAKGSSNIDEADEGESSARPEGLSTARSLDGAFTVQTNKLDANKHMMEYIETEMGKYRGVSANDATASTTADLSVDDLYQVPSHLKVVDKQPVSEGNVAMAAKMLTSIQEVDLGTESRARNARATNIVVSELSHPTNSSFKDPPPSSTMRYQKSNDSSDRSSKATDDAALQRFKKRMRR
ncbi:hypothetical protein GGI21_001223 [Coemansia aciculifera]|uniref:Uncharacterized protein n=1 Tax=Coemansia aciculifera TaxID=417176 RepID=A0ACC1LUN6_9FUNG|nr:hypothetical protein IWW38_006072 [Coemansia aciculifera]KAJ2910092.1 hypothetical protein GGI21_001223 [Coemansia aciculifera]